jgi:H+/gluconate symporter-like permease
MRRAFLVLSLAAAAAVPLSSTAHADACSTYATHGTAIPHTGGYACVRWIGVYGCEYQSGGVDPDAWAEVEVCY